jgi:hypothetical protein
MQKWWAWRKLETNNGSWPLRFQHWRVIMISYWKVVIHRLQAEEDLNKVLAHVETILASVLHIHKMVHSGTVAFELILNSQKKATALQGPDKSMAYHMLHSLTNTTNWIIGPITRWKGHSYWVSEWGQWMLPPDSCDQDPWPHTVLHRLYRLFAYRWKVGENCAIVGWGPPME